MRIFRSSQITLLCGLLLAAGCGVRHQRSDIVISGLASPTSTAGTSGTTCSCSSAASTSNPEPEFLKAGTTGLFPCVVVENRLPNNSGNLRNNTNDLKLRSLKLHYEPAGGALFSVPDQEVQVNGYVKAGGSSSVPASVVPPGLSFPAGAPVRIYLQFTGELLDGSGVRSSEYEYIAFGCGGACPSLTCVVP